MLGLRIPVRATLLVALLMLAPAALAACGGGDTAEPTPTPTPLAAPVGEAAAAGSASEAPNDTPTAEPTEGTTAEITAVAGTNQAAERPESPLSPLSPIVPTPTPTPETSGLTAQAGEDSGGLTGRILVRRSTGDVPVAGLILGLAEIIYDEEGVARASGYDPATPNRTDTDSGGGFALSDVPPGTYTLILDAVMTQYQLNDPVTGETIMVTIEPGEVVEVGVLRYDSLPVPGFTEPG
jgi:hypothetical protein